MVFTPPTLQPVAIGLGANLGNSQATLEQALEVLNQGDGVEVLGRSSWYRSAPKGPVQPDYLNGCALLQVRLAPEDLLDRLLETENRFGRVRAERWGPRTLDLDLLLYGQLRLHTGRLQVPHPRLAERAFVLLPLLEIAPEWIDPISGHTVQELAGALVERGGVQRLESSRP
jgi:2-amino-4-hydroxy-6-hydroxymethyldihydropteridine diphosphokinase